MKVYGADICIDCRNFKAVWKNRGFSVDFVDIIKDTGNLKEFLKLRDTQPIFAGCREQGGIGIPLFVREDGCMTFDLNEAMAWLGQPPVADEELPEHR